MAKNPLGIRLLGDRMLVVMDKPEEVTKSGIILAPSAQKEAQIGTVVLLGSEISEDIKLGDRLVYTKYGLQDFEHDGTTYYLLNAEDVLAIIE